MSVHNIIGSERSGPHVMVRQFKARPTRTGFWVITAIQGLVCTIPTAVILALMLG